MSDETRSRLQALGYEGETAPARDEADREPDTKSGAESGTGAGG